MGQQLLYFVLQPFRPPPHERKTNAAALGAGVRRRKGISAVVTLQLFHPPVVDQGNAAIGAAEHMAALPADDARRKAAPVEKEQALLLLSGPFGQGIFQPQGKLPRRPRTLQPLPLHINDFDAGQRPAVHAPCQLQQGELSRPGIVIRFHRWRCRSQDDHRMVHASPHQGQVSRVIPELLLLLIRGVVLLIDHNDAEAGEGREDGGTGADGDLHQTFANPPPSVISLTGRQPAVQDGDAGAEARVEAAHQLRGKGNFRDKHQRLPALLQHIFDGGQVNLCFTASRNTMEQKRCVLP